MNKQRNISAAIVYGLLLSLVLWALLLAGVYKVMTWIAPLIP